MATVHYLAYGSNLHPLRLAARVQSARVLGVVELPGYRLAFHKRSVDGSGKCLLYPDEGERVYGVVYEFDSRDKASLDAAEGRGNGYAEQTLELDLNGRSIAPYVYVARSSHIDPTLVPYDWYKQLVLAGARHHGFDAAYIASIEATPAMEDPEAERQRDHDELLKRIAGL